MELKTELLEGLKIEFGSKLNLDPDPEVVVSLVGRGLKPIPWTISILSELISELASELIPELEPDPMFADSI